METVISRKQERPYESIFVYHAKLSSLPEREGKKRKNDLKQNKRLTFMCSRDAAVVQCYGQGSEARWFLTFTEQDPDLASGGEGLNLEPLRKPNMCTQDRLCASCNFT